MQLGTYQSKSSKAVYAKRFYSDENLIYFSNTLNLIDWFQLCRINDVNLAYEYFYNVFKYYFGLNFSKRSYNVNYLQTKKNFLLIGIYTTFSVKKI